MLQVKISKASARKRGRAAVVSWDLGHNPAGRAYVLYQLLKQGLERRFDWPDVVALRETDLGTTKGQ